MFLPKTLAHLYNGWMRFGSIMNKITTSLILSIVYLVLITPPGLVMRAFGNDPLNRKLDDSVNTYRVKSQAIETENLEKPF